MRAFLGWQRERDVRWRGGLAERVDAVRKGVMRFLHTSSYIQKT